MSTPAQICLHVLDWLPAAGLHCFTALCLCVLHVHPYLCGALTGLQLHKIYYQYGILW